MAKTNTTPATKPENPQEISENPGIITRHARLRGLNAKQYRTIRHISIAAGEVKRLGLCIARSDHDATGKYSTYNQYYREYKRLLTGDERDTLPQDIIDYTARNLADGPIKSHITRVTNARSQGLPVDSRPPRAIRNRVNRVPSVFGFPMRKSYIDEDAHAITMPASRTQRAKWNCKAAEEYREMQRISKLSTEDNRKDALKRDWDDKSNHPRIPHRTKTQVIADADKARERAIEIVQSMKLTEYKRAYLRERIVRIPVPDDIDIATIRSVQVIPVRGGIAYDAAFAIKSDDRNYPDTVGKLPDGLISNDTARVAIDEARRRYEWKYANDAECKRIDASIDPGMKNLMTVTLLAIYDSTDKKDRDGNPIEIGVPFYSFAIDGGWLMSILRLTNKQIGKLNADIAHIHYMTQTRWEKEHDGVTPRLRKNRRLSRMYQRRRDKIECCGRRSRTVLDIVSKTIVLVCGYAGVSRICVGHNVGQKQRSRLRKKNEGFQGIRYSRVRERLAWWCGLLGWSYVEHEESYTSKASALDNDALPVFSEGERGSFSFSGRRRYRGLYVSGSGVVLSADVNGALNIWRKCSHDGPVCVMGSPEWLAGVYHPYRVSVQPD